MSEFTERRAAQLRAEPGDGTIGLAAGRRLINDLLNGDADASQVKVDWFTDHQHEEIIGRMHAVLASGMPVDAITVMSDWQPNTPMVLELTTIIAMDSAGEFDDCG